MQGLDISGFSYWAILFAAISMFVVGAIWYGGPLSKPWMREVGVKDKDAREGAVRAFLGTFLLSLLSAFLLAFFIGDGAGPIFGSFAGSMVGIWIAAAIGTNYLFEGKSLTLFAINAGYNLIGFTVMGAVIGQWL